MKYNVKKFLVPNSIQSCALFHAKINDDNVAKLIIHDCNGAIRLWNKLDNQDERKKMLEKLATLERGIKELRLAVAQLPL